MKEIKLKRLVLNNWKSLNLDVSFNEKKTTIEGRNGIGKSSLQSAWNWLLNGGWTNANYPKNHELFDNRFALNEKTPLASVEATLEVDGFEYRLRKTAEAKFTRKRGSSEYEKAKSDVYVHYIDDIETSVSDYNSWIENNIAPMSMMPYLLSGDFFSSLCEDDKTKARKVLEDVVGEIHEEDFKGDYSVLKEKMSRYNVDQIEEMAKNANKPLNKRLEEIPSIIELKENTKADYDREDYDAIAIEIEEKKNRIKDIDDEILGRAEAIKPIKEKRINDSMLILKKESELKSKRMDYESVFDSKMADIDRQIRDLDNENARIRKRNESRARELGNKKNLLNGLKTTRDILSSRRETLLKERDDAMSLVFQEDKCPYCGQELPMDMLEKSRQRFNDTKKVKVSSIVKEGKEIRSRLDNLENEIKSMEDSISNPEPLETLVSSAELIAKKDALMADFEPYENTEEFMSLHKEIESMKASMGEITVSDDDGMLTIEKSHLISDIESLNRRYAFKDMSERIEEEIKELREEQREVAQSIASNEKIIDKCVEWREEKADIISYRVNGMMDECEIVMWNKQKDGTIAPNCLIQSKDGVKYATLNNSSRLKINIAIQRMFMRHFDVTLPIWLDEASVFDDRNLPRFDTQSVYLYASNSNTLVVE